MKKLLLSAMVCGGFLLMGTNANAQSAESVQQYVKEKALFEKQNPNATKAQANNFVAKMAEKYPSVVSTNKKNEQNTNAVVQKQAAKAAIKQNSKPNLKGMQINKAALKNDLIIDLSNAKKK